MKTEKRWKETYRASSIKKHFPPRIQKDLLRLSIPLPKSVLLDFEKGESLYLYGEVSSGKTLLACEIMLEEIKRVWLKSGYYKSPAFEFVSAPDLLFDLRQTYTKPDLQDGQTAEERILNKLTTETYFLIIDDFAVFGRPSDWVLNILYMIVNNRLENQLPTIFTSNLDLNQISELFDDRISSRIERISKIVRKESWKKNL